MHTNWINRLRSFKIFSGVTVFNTMIAILGDSFKYKLWYFIFVIWPSQWRAPLFEFIESFACRLWTRVSNLMILCSISVRSVTSVRRLSLNKNPFSLSNAIIIFTIGSNRMTRRKMINNQWLGIEVLCCVQN